MNNDLKNYVLELVKCALENRKPPEKPENITFEEIYNISLLHKINNLIFYSVEMMDNKPETSLYEKWSEDRDRAIARDIIQKNELEEIKKAAVLEQIRIIPVKGFFIKGLYPHSDMRFMADLDILIDSEKRQSLRKIMQNAGYTIRSYNKGNHDVYYKEPCLNIEIHNKLFTPCDKKLHSYYKSVWEYALETSPYYYSFGLEDNFIYFTAHMAKHYYAGGTGIRSVIDFYLFLKKYKNSMDFNYIWSEFKKLGLCSFYEMMADLSEIWFGNASGIKQTDLIAEYIFESGVYGTKHNNILNQINKNGKYKYILNRLFPNINIMKESFPILKRHCYILPLLWIYRLFFSALTKYKNIRYEIVTLIKNK